MVAGGRVDYVRSLAWMACAVSVLGASGAIGAGCGTDAAGVEACNQIEDARCRRAPACGISLEPPYSTGGTAVDACIRFYDTACLHGLDTSDPGPVVVGQCVSAINKGGCGVVATPQTSAACAWLVPAATPDASDAAEDTEDADAGTDSPD